jgi:ribonuclease Z
VAWAFAAWTWEAIDKLEIWGGRWTLDRVEDLIYRVVLRGARAPLKIEFYEIEPDLLMEDDTFTLRAFPVNHRGAGCFGFTFEEKSRRPFLPDKAEVLGVPAGPERKRLVRGQAITLADGRLIQPDDVLGEWQPGAKLVFVGDAGRTDNLVDEAHGADMLVIEATYLHQEAGLAREFGHLTARQAAKLAHRAGAKQLILTHLSRRNRERDTLAEAQAIFPNTVVARDFDHFRVVKEKQKGKEE